MKMIFEYYQIWNSLKKEHFIKKIKDQATPLIEKTGSTNLIDIFKLSPPILSAANYIKFKDNVNLKGALKA